MAAARIEKGDPWKSRARCLQLRLRDRFRVTVDRRRRIFSDSSTTLRRLLQRFRDFRSETIPSSSALIRKRVGKNFNSEEESVILRMLQAVAVPVLGNVCHVFMHGFNRIQVYGIEKLHDALLHRPKDKSLVTVSNHVASIDDPFIIAALLPPRVLLDAQNLRWTLCATDRCFKNPVTSAFFRSVKVLPVSRGDGIYQKGMDMAISKLNRGGWVHIFPEGSRSRDGGKTMGSSKRGVGRLVVDADNIPMVIPFVHTGMQEIMPIGASLPRIGNTVTVLVGDPIHFDDLLDGEEAKTESNGKLYDAVASRIGHRLHELKVQVDQLTFQQVVESQNRHGSNTERAAEILQQIDWESFGIGSVLSNDDENLPIQEIRTQKTEPVFQEPAISERYFKIGITSRMRGFVGPAELMGFAARGLLMSHKAEKISGSDRVIGPLKAWRQYLEANVFRQWNRYEL